MDLSMYETEKVLGEGSFAIVTRLKHKQTGEAIAVKTLTAKSQKDLDYVSWFKREVKILEALQGNPHVVPLLFADVNRFIIVMPAAEQNLYNYIQYKNSALELIHRVHIFEDILCAMTDAHSKNFLHRDLAPANILIFNQEASH